MWREGAREREREREYKGMLAGTLQEARACKGVPALHLQMLRAIAFVHASLTNNTKEKVVEHVLSLALPGRQEQAQEELVALKRLG